MEKKFNNFPNLIKCLRVDRFGSANPENVKNELELKEYKNYDPLMSE